MREQQTQTSMAADDHFSPLIGKVTSLTGSIFLALCGLFLVVLGFQDSIGRGLVFLFAVPIMVGVGGFALAQLVVLVDRPFIRRHNRRIIADGTFAGPTTNRA